MNSQDSSHNQRSRSRRQQKPQLWCQARPEQRLEGNGKKYFINLLTPEQLQQRGINHRRAQLVIEAYPVLVLSNEWLEKLFCPQCGGSRWCHITRHDTLQYTVRWAARKLWQQVAYLDPMHPNPTVSDFSRRAARRINLKRADGHRFVDPG